MKLLDQLKRYLQNRSGASAVEFAFIAPILFTLLVGTIDFGMYAFQKMQIQNTAHSVAEYVMQTQSIDNVETVAQEVYDGNYNAITVASEFVCACSDGVAQECPLNCGSNDTQRRYVNVDISGDFTPIIPYQGISTQMTIESSVRLRVD